MVIIKGLISLYIPTCGGEIYHGYTSYTVYTYKNRPSKLAIPVFFFHLISGYHLKKPRFDPFVATESCGDGGARRDSGGHC